MKTTKQKWLHQKVSGDALFPQQSSSLKDERRFLVLYLHSSAPPTVTTEAKGKEKFIKPTSGPVAKKTRIEGAASERQK